MTSERFFFRRSAERYCWENNAYRLIRGYKDFNYYIHDTKEDK